MPPARQLSRNETNVLNIVSNGIVDLSQRMESLATTVQDVRERMIALEAANPLIHKGLNDGIDKIVSTIADHEKRLRIVEKINIRYGLVITILGTLGGTAFGLLASRLSDVFAKLAGG